MVTRSVSQAAIGYGLAVCETLKVDGVDEPEILDNYTLHVTESGGVGGVMIEKLDKLLMGVKSGDHGGQVKSK